jgi:spore germination protein GerM
MVNGLSLALSGSSFMKDRPKNNQLSLSAIAGITVAALVVGGSAAWLAYHTLTASKTPSTPPISQPRQSPVEQPTSQEERAQVYWLTDTGERMELVSAPVMLEKSASKEEVLETALKELLAGSKNSSATTAIPQGTKLLGVSWEKDGVHLNLSSEFTTGGGSASMTGRLAQIIYTATSADPKSQVWIDVEGKPLELLGEGEGLMVDQPMTRQIFEENFQL